MIRIVFSRNGQYSQFFIETIITDYINDIINKSMMKIDNNDRIDYLIKQTIQIKRITEHARFGKSSNNKRVIELLI